MRKIKRWKQGIAVPWSDRTYRQPGLPDVAVQMEKIPEAKEKQEAAIRQGMQIQQIL